MSVANQLNELGGGRIVRLLGYALYEFIATQTGPTTYAQPVVERMLPLQWVLPRATASDWLIHEIRFGDRAQLMVQEGAIPGDLFASGLNMTTMHMSEVFPGTVISIMVEYVGANPGGGVFQASLISETPGGRRVSLAFLGDVPIGRGGAGTGPRVDAGQRVCLKLEDEAWLFYEKFQRVSSIVKQTASESHALLDDLKEYGDGAGMRVHNVQYPIDPVPLVSLHAHVSPRRAVLVAVDEHSGKVVLEIGHDEHPERLAFLASCRLGGFEPRWWPEAHPR